MQDQLKRNIDYLRISITDRCNLRCVYCMPQDGVEWVPHGEILTYEELLRLARIFAGQGVRRIRLTGGEPLCRKGVAGLVGGLKGLEGIETVTLTTNGVTLAEHLPGLLEAGLDGVNISLDTLDREQFHALTRRDELVQVLEGMEMAMNTPGLTVKVNCVPGEENKNQLLDLARLAKDRTVSVRFIELMPLGHGAGRTFPGEDEVRRILEREFGPMTPREGVVGGGPCQYWSLPGFQGGIGFISPMSHNFCADCNRVRLTARGFLKTCLHYDRGRDLGGLLRKGGTDQELVAAVMEAIQDKPGRHHFEKTEGQPRVERHGMSQIGG